MRRYITRMSGHEIKNKRFMAYTASAMYAAGAIDGAVEGFLPRDPPFALVPVIAAAVVFLFLVTVGARLPWICLAMLGPLGIAAISYALATTPGAGDGAVLYTMPVLWTTFFYGRRGAGAILACVATGHAVALLVLPSSSVYPGRWIDVMVSVSATAVVVLALEGRNRSLLGRLAAEARTDPLTGLLNRRGLNERAEVEIARARRDNTPMAVASFDLDHFKLINDEWGHETGDQVLVWIGRVLTGESRDIDTVARVGGEELVALLPDTDVAGADEFTERVRAALDRHEPQGLPPVSVSAGVVSARDPQDLQTMLQRADSALYVAKRGGRDRTVSWAAPGSRPSPSDDRVAA
jgi:diguanylate cyclase (GGDEF)-like protein